MTMTAATPLEALVTETAALTHTLATAPETQEGVLTR